MSKITGEIEELDKRLIGEIAFMRNQL